MLRDEMARAGLDAGAIEVREVDTESDAARERFVGSPTIRVDGADVQPPRASATTRSSRARSTPRDEPIGLTCRVYRLRDGRVSPLPDRRDVQDALARALEGGD